jgi:RNA polymerase sigma factor (sigma-70 family)
MRNHAGSDGEIMKRFRRGFDSFLSTTLDYQESKQLDIVRLECLVVRLREGDKSVRNEIIAGHYRMVMAIVAERYAKKPSMIDDIIGVALVSLVEAVDNAAPPESRLHDNNITAYITSTVHWRIKDFFADNHAIRVPGRTVRYKIALGAEFETLVPGDPGSVLEYDPRDQTNDDNSIIKKGSYNLPYAIPAAKPICESLEFKEAIRRSVTNEIERAIITMYAQGYTYEEIGKAVGYSTPRVGQILPTIRDRLEKNYKG